MLFLVLPILLLAGELPMAAADGDVVPADLRTTGTETWYGIYMGTSKVGWAVKQTGPLQKAGRSFLRTRYVLFMRTQSSGKVRVTRIERRKIFDARAPHTLLRASAVTQRGKFRKQVSIEVKNGKLEAVIHEAESRRRVKIEGAPPTFADEVRPTTWFRGARKTGETLRYKQLDLSALRLGAATIRVTGVSDAPTRLYRADLISQAGDRDRVAYDARGEMVSTKMMGLLSIRREARDEALKLGEAAKPLLQGEATVDKRLGEGEKVRNMVLRARGKGVMAVPSGPGQDATFDAASKTLTLRIGPRLTTPRRATAAEVKRALAETTAYPIRHRVVKALALETAAKGTTEAEKVEALIDFVDTFVMDSHTLDPLTALDVLAEQEGDCNEHALLFTTLARAAGIPAREVYGLVYKDDNSKTFGRHVWNEVVIDGFWIPVDPTWGEYRASAAHVRLGAAGEGADLRLALAGTRFELLSIERDPERTDPQARDE